MTRISLCSRRGWLQGTGALATSMALAALERSAMANDDYVESNAESAKGEMDARLPAQAKQCIFLTMEGGPSHIDTFDPKPKLAELHLQEFQRSGEMRSAMESGKRYFVQSPFSFIKAGESGADIASNWNHLANIVDQICFYRGCQVDSVNHPTAMYQLNTGNRFGGDPSLGAWLLYGLGSLNENVPAYVVMPEVALPQGGPSNWSNGFLPARYQGTSLRPQGSPLLDLHSREEISRDHQRANLDLLKRLNETHAEQRMDDDELRARMEAYELAFRMQVEVPELIDLSQESQQTLDRYGVNREPTDRFGRKCLLARRLIEKGVRFVQLYAGTWDSHDYIERAHGQLVSRVDQPIAALVADLAERGLLESTLIVWCGEFGRSPDNGVRGGTAFGRDHNPKAMTVWLAGGEVAAGTTVGATDEIGAEAVECVHPIRDLHVTLLRLLGLDDRHLTYFHGGRFKQLSQFGGEVINELIN